jgi:hypothetical protein
MTASVAWGEQRGHMRRFTGPLLVVSVLVLLALMLSGCATPETIVKTIKVPVTVIVPVTLEVPATCSACPAFPTVIPGPTMAPPPTEVPPPTAAPADPLKTPKGIGSYLVGVDIAPGIWRSSGTQPEDMSGCALTIKSLAGELEDISYNPPGSTIRIPAGDHQVVIEGCVWALYKE